jgi:triosephosphate isomerase
VVCPPAPYLAQLTTGLQGSTLQVGAQNLSERTAGAFTGEHSAEMLLDLGVRWAIVGHSERRSLYGETDAVVAAKTARALAVGVRPIVCVGETLDERESGQTEVVVARQLAAVLQACPAAALVQGAIAYEPVWAIGTGHTASPEQAQAVHAAIRAQLSAADSAAAQQVRILYGGSVKAGNAATLFAQADIDGGLIGGASLVADEFRAICEAGRR